MDAVLSARDDLSSEAVDFIRFCYRRRRAGWPEIYDEMCAVASRGLFNGWTRDELAAQGITFSLAGMPSLASLVRRVIVEEAAAQPAAAPRRRRAFEHDSDAEEAGSSLLPALSGIA
ncbi:MAG TPA: hypothetical protein VF802_04895 [Candidatus Limnocylindrales bacterium]